MIRLLCVRFLQQVGQLSYSDWPGQLARVGKKQKKNQGFGSAFFFADPDPDPGKNFDADPGGIRGRGLGVKGKMNFFLSFFHVSDDS